VKDDSVANFVQAFEILGAGTANHPVDFIAPFEQELGQIDPILPGNSGNPTLGAASQFLFREDASHPIHPTFG